MNNMLSKIKVIYVVLLLGSLNGQARIIQVKNKCFKLELVGSILDPVKCKETQILMKNIDCRTGEYSGANRKLAAPLTKCSNKKAEGAFQAEGEKINFTAVLKDNPEFEVWEMSDYSTDLKMAKAKTDVVKSTNDDDADQQGLAVSVDSLSLEANWVMGFSPNKESIINSSNPSSGGYYGSSTQAVMAEQIYQNQLSFDYLFFKINKNINDKTQVQFSLSGGQKSSFWYSSPYGIKRSNPIELSDATLFYQTASDEKVGFGLWSDESIRTFQSKYVFNSTADTIFTPHIYSGVRWEKESDTQFLGVFFVNGWNEIQDVNNSFGTGFNFIKDWTENLTMNTLIYVGDEGATGLGTESRNLKHIDLGVVYNKKFNFQGIFGKWGSDYDYSLFGMGYTHAYSDAEDISARYEIVKNKSALWFSNGWENFYNLEFAYRRTVSEDFVFKSAMAYSNLLGSTQVAGAVKSRFYFLTSLTIQL